MVSPERKNTSRAESVHDTDGAVLKDNPKIRSNHVFTQSAKNRSEKKKIYQLRAYVFIVLPVPRCFPKRANIFIGEVKLTFAVKNKEDKGRITVIVKMNPWSCEPTAKPDHQKSLSVDRLDFPDCPLELKLDRAERKLSSTKRQFFWRFSLTFDKNS